MNSIDSLVDGIIGRTVCLDDAFIDDADRKSGICIFYFGGTVIRSKADFFNQAKRVMKLPDYFGHNWDAFEECINDLSWIEADGYIFAYDNADIFFREHPDDKEILLSILHNAKHNWQLEKIPFEALLAGTDRFYKMEQ